MLAQVWVVANRATSMMMSIGVPPAPNTTNSLVSMNMQALGKQPLPRLTTTVTASHVAHMRHVTNNSLEKLHTCHDGSE